MDGAQEAVPDPSVAVEAFRRRVDSGFEAAVADLGSLVEIPGMAWDAFDPAHLENSAAAVARLLSGAGLGDVRVVRAAKGDGTPGAPAVLARNPARSGWPNVLLYAHHDVQPPGDQELWESPPFAPAERHGRLYGRGVADNKAGVIMHLAAFRALCEERGDSLGLGITFFIEGEEEAGSPSLPSLLARHEEEFAADVMVIADSGNWQVGVPALTTSLRGLAAGIVEVRVLEHALHSGTYGGPVIDALTVLSRVLASLHDDDGNVAVSGLGGYDDGDLPELTEPDFRSDARLRKGVRLAGSGSLASRLWTKPALSVIGIDAPPVAVSTDTLQPVARAKISLSVAPGSSVVAAMEALRRHIEAHTPFGAEVAFIPAGMTPAFKAKAGTEATLAMLAAMEKSWGKPAVEMGVGGSIPVAGIMAERFPKAAVLINGAEDPDSRAHGANESIDLADFRNGILAEALFLDQLNTRS
jgi:cysteinylglycine-S-conjugate dipeptidase